MSRMKNIDVDKHMGAKLRMARMMREMSQEKLGVHLDVTFQQIQKYESGKNALRPSQLILLCNALGVPLRYFFDGLMIENTDAAPMPDLPERFFAKPHARSIAESCVKMSTAEMSLIAQVSAVMSGAPPS